MTTKKNSISRFSVLVLGALLVGLPATAALAAEPTTLPDAQAMAQHYREQADRYRALGGVGYKAGLVQRAEADAAKYSALAEQLAAPAVAVPVPSPEAEHYTQLAKQYRAFGGVGYKTGLVQRAEADAARYSAPAGQVATPPRSPEAEHYARLAEQYRAMGGVAYKSGRVQWAEAEQRKYEMSARAATPAISTPNRTCAKTPTEPSGRTLACVN